MGAVPDGEQAALRGSPFKMQAVDVAAGDSVRFSDFSPFLLVSEDSHADLVKGMGVDSYPIAPFRPNIVVGGTKGPWAEETWRNFTIGGEGGGTRFRYLKRAPRCTVPSRDQKTGGFNKEIMAKKTLPQVTLRKMFPAKCTDDEWGSEWEGPMYGIHVAHGGVAGTLREGDPLRVSSYGYDSLREKLAANWGFLLVLALVALGVVGAHVAAAHVHGLRFDEL